MPSSKGYRDLESGRMGGGISALLNECLGTFFIAWALFGTSSFNLVAVGAMLTFFTYFEADGQYNPAITVSTMLGKDASTSVRTGLLAILAQAVGATVAFVLNNQMGGDYLQAVGAGDLPAATNDMLIVIVLLLTYACDSSGLGRGLSYFSALSAFPSAGGANSAIVLGGVIANAAMGNGLDLSTGMLVSTITPLVAAALFGLLAGTISSALGTTVANEGGGTFFFALMSFAISSNADAASAPLALGATLYTVSVAWKNATYNPAITIAKLAKSRSYDTLLDPTRDVLIQVAAATLAATVASASWSPLGGVGATVPAASAMGLPAVLELVFTAVFALIYTAGKGSELIVIFAYFASVVSCASTFNPALPLGAFLAGFVPGNGGGGAFALTSVVVPIIGGAVAGLVADMIRGDTSEAVGAFVLFLTLGSNATDSALGALTLGSMLATLGAVFNGSYFNPAITLASGGFSSSNIRVMLFQLAGAAAGALLANAAGVAAGAAVSDGLGGFKPAAAEVLLVALLAKMYGVSSIENGLSYAALLTVFGGAAGSVANPAITLGGWLGNGLLGGGFSFEVPALLGLLSHAAAPLAGTMASPHLFALVSSTAPLDGIRLSTKECFASFVLVTSIAGIQASATLSSDLSLALTLLAIFNIYRQADTDVFPAISAFRAFGKGADVAGFARNATSQVLGAVLAGLLATWLFGSSGGTAAASVGDSLYNGVLFGLFLAWAYEYMAHDNVGFALAVFAAASVFNFYDGAAALGIGLVDALLGGGGFGFLSDVAWLTALAAPLVGGVLAGRLLALLGK